jgi:hypothetical protein
MAPSVSSETQLTRVERTWRFSCHARDRVIGPFIVCIEVLSSSLHLPKVLKNTTNMFFKYKYTVTGTFGVEMKVRAV